MPTSHKPRKRFVPKHHFNAAMATLERLRVNSAAPLQPRQVRDNVLYCLSALEAIRTGQGNDDHANHLALAANVSLVLCEAGLGSDWIDKVREAQDAIVTLSARRRRIGHYVASGVELQRIGALLDLHDAQLHSEGCTEGMMVQALSEITRRRAAGHVIEVAAV